MSRISEKVAYLDGLMDGMNIAEDKYGKMFTAIVDALDCIAEEMGDHEDAMDDIYESIDEIFENLDEYDEILFDEDYADDDDDPEDYDEDFQEVVCPHCGKVIDFDADLLDSPDGIVCPGCSEKIDFLQSEDNDEE